MIQCRILVPACLLAFALATTAQAIDLTGKWTGEISYDKEKLASFVDGLVAAQIPPNLPEAEREKIKTLIEAQKPAIMEKITSELSKKTMELEVKGDGTYVVTVDPGDGKAKEEKKGTWKVAEETAEKMKLTTQEEGSDEAKTSTLVIKGPKTILMELPEDDAKKLPEEIRGAFLGMLLKKQ